MSTSPHTRRGIHRPNAQRLSISLAPLVAQRSLLFRIQTDLANKASYSELSPLESSGLYTATASARLISAALSSASLPAHRRRRHRLKTPASSTPTSLKSSASVYSQDSGDDGGDIDGDGDGDEWEDEHEDEDNEHAGDSDAAISPLTLPTTTPGVPSPASPGTPLHAQPMASSKPRRRDAKKRITMSRFTQNRRHAVAFSPSVQLEDFCFSPFDDGTVVTTTTTTTTTESCSSASASASSSLDSGSGSETSVVSTPPDSPLVVPPAAGADATTKPAVSVNPMHTVDLDFYLQRKSQIQMANNNGNTNPGAQLSSSSGLGMTIPGKGLVKIVSRLSSLSLIQNRRKSDMPPPSHGSRPTLAPSTRHARSNSTSSLPAIRSFSSSSSSSSSVSFSSSSLDYGPVLSRPPRALPTIPATPAAAVSTSMDSDSDGMPVPVTTAPVDDDEQETREQQSQVRVQRSPSPELPNQAPQPQSHSWKSKRPTLSPPAPSTFTKGHRRHHSSPVPTMVRREWVQGSGVNSAPQVGVSLSDDRGSGKRTLPPVPRVPSEYIV